MLKLMIEFHSSEKILNSKGTRMRLEKRVCIGSLFECITSEIQLETRKY